MDIRNDLMKAGMAGAIGAVGSYLFLGERGGEVPLPILKVLVPTSIAIGASVAAASLVSDVAHDYVFPFINKSAKWSKIESALFQLAITGGVTAGLLVYGSGAPADVSSVGYAFIVGAGSAVAGDYIQANFIKPGTGLLF